MGQYHYVVNLDKKQYLHPHRFGDGLKLLEFGYNAGGTMTALALLLGEQAADAGRGGGDPYRDSEALVGSWAGDRIAIVGDYATENHKVGWDHEVGDGIYHRCADDDSPWTEMSAAIIPLMEANGSVRPGATPIGGPL